MSSLISPPKYWKIPPKIKIYEALGSLADGRIHIEGNIAKIYSSSGNKFYTVTYDPDTKAIMANDNGSYWQGYLGYPSIAYLLSVGIIPYSLEVSEWLKDIKWKDINTKLKNDWSETEQCVQRIVADRGGTIEKLNIEIDRIFRQITETKYALLGSKTRPPSGY